MSPQVEDPEWSKALIDVGIQKRPQNVEGDAVLINFPTIQKLKNGDTENELVLCSQDGANAIMPNMLDFMIKKLKDMISPEGEP